MIRPHLFLAFVATSSCVGAPSSPPPLDDYMVDSTSDRNPESCDDDEATEELIDASYYAPCPQGLCSSTEICATDAATPSHTVCAMIECSSDCDCPASPSGTATPICTGFSDMNLPSACVLSCEGSQECPAGMNCTSEGFCMFPL